MKTINQLLVMGMFAFMVLHANEGIAQWTFGEYQSAKMVGKGNVEATAHYTGVNLNFSGESQFVFNNLGFQTGLGLGERIEFRARYDRLWLKNYGFGDGTNVISFGPKIGTKNNRLAFLLPFATGFGDDVDASWQFNPTIFVTLPLSNNANLTFTPKYMISLEEGTEIGDNPLGLNLGAGIGITENWVARPEVGLIFYPSGSGSFFNFGLGASWVFGKPAN